MIDLGAAKECGVGGEVEVTVAAECGEKSHLFARFVAFFCFANDFGQSMCWF